MRTIDLVKQYRHIFGTDYTQDASCEFAWLMTEGSGTALNDSSANNNDGTLRASYLPDWSDTVPNANISHSLDYVFESSHGDAVYATSLPATVKDPGDDLSFVLWGYIDNPQPSTYSGRLLSTRNNYGWFFGTSSAYAVTFYWSGGTALTHKANNASFSQSTWTHFAVTHDGSTTAANALIYVDGVEVSYQTTTNGDSLQSADGTPTLGEESTLSYETAIDGKLAEPGLFSRILDSTEINEIMDNGLVGGGAPPAAAGFMTTNSKFWGV